MVICLERGADLHMAQLMPLPLTVSCFSKIQTGFTFLLPAHPGSPGQQQRPFNGHLFGTTRVSRYQKGKTNLDFTGARDSEWQWHQLGHMQVCTLLLTDNHAITLPLCFLQAGCPSCRPTNSVKALKATIYINTHTHNRLTAFCPGLPRVGRYQKKHSPTHTHPDHRTSFIIFLHLQRSVTSSLFSLRA